jgi:hypothetical protein
MKGNFKMNALIALGMMVTSACGYSPILNHNTPNREQQDASAKVEKKCSFSFSKQGLCADLDLSKAPKNSGDEGSVKVYFWNPNQANAYVNPSVNWKFTPWMSSMGHGTSKTEIANAKDQNGNDIPGVFVISKLSFVMGGEWDLFIVMEPTQRDPNKESEKRNVDKVSYLVNE